MSPHFSLLFLTLGVCVAAAHSDVIASYRIVEADKPVSRSPETLTLASNDALLTQTWNGRFGAKGATYRRTLQLTQYDKKRVVTMDTTLGIYKVEPLEPKISPGVTLPSLRLTRLDDEKILGFDTHHFFLDFSYPKSSLAKEGLLARQEIWLLPSTSNAQIPARARNLRSIKSASGDAQLLPEIQSGIFIKKTIFNAVPADKTPAKIVYTEEISALSIGDIAPSNFEIPSDYRELSPVQFAAALGKEKRDALDRKVEEMDRQADAT